MSVEVSWLPPETPNGPITSYAVGIISPAPLILKSVPGWTTELTMKFDFVKNEEYSFWVNIKSS